MDYKTEIVDAPIHDPNSDYHFSEGSYFPTQFKIVGFFLAIASLTLCINLNIIGFILLPICLCIILAKKELTISFSLSKYRYSLKIIKFKIGSWEALPKFEYISMFSAKKRQDVAANSSMTASLAYSEIEVNLIYNKSKRLTVYTTNDYESSFQIAKQFSKQLDLEIFDATKREGVWIQ